MRQLRAFNAWRKHLDSRKLGSTEGCSFVPDFDFKDCCEAHDRHYETHDVLRDVADDELYDCIRAHGHPWLAWGYWFFVHIFGQPAWDSYGGTKPDG